MGYIYAWPHLLQEHRCTWTCRCTWNEKQSFTFGRLKILLNPLSNSTVASVRHWKYLWCYIHPPIHMYLWCQLFQVMISFGGLLEECLPCLLGLKVFLQGCLVFSKNILLRRVEFGIWLKHHRKIWNFTRRSRVKFQIFLWCLKAKFQIPLSAEGCLWLTPRHLFINWKICGIWAKFSQILTNLWEFGSNSTDFEWWFRVESGVTEYIFPLI